MDNEWVINDEGDSWLMQMPDGRNLIVGAGKLHYFSIWQGSKELVSVVFKPENFADPVAFAKKTCLAIYHEMRKE